MDVQALRRDLESQIDGEVRFDKVSRALYSTDASVYQIEPAGVVVVKSREDVVRAVTICAKHGCPLTMRGGGTSQAGQAIGEGVQIDTSKYFNKLLEVNVDERWARIEPGIVLDELNAALRPHNLRFAPDISTASRATVGGMMANNSSGARSVMYGKTIDHVLEQDVVLSDGSLVHFRALASADVDRICQQNSLEAACYREVRRLAFTHADEIETSMMLYIDPGSVDMRRAVKEYTPSPGPLLLTRRPGAPGTFSASGVWGDPTLATREKGKVIVEGLVTGILEDIEAIRRATPPAPMPATTTVPPPTPTPTPVNRQTTRPQSCTPGDERTIRGFGDAFALHWNNGDATNLSLLWSVDGDVVHPDGLTERGRETIRANRAALFMRQEYRGSKHPLMLGNIRCVTADVAVVDGKWELRGVSDANGKPLPTFEGLLTLVVGRGPTGWAIEAYRYTQKPAAAPMPTWLKRPGYPGRSNH